MKLKHLLTLASLMIGGGNLWAYTTSDLTAAGWTQVSSLTDVSSNYYIFVDAGTTYTAGMSVAHTANASSSLYYQTLANPFGVVKQVWKLAESSGTYTIQAVNDDCYIYGNSTGYGRTVVASGGTNGTFTFTLTNGVWHIVNATGSYSPGNAFGPWEGTKTSGSNYDVAINKKDDVTTGNGDNAPGFIIYSIPRTIFSQDVTSDYITNPSFELGSSGTAAKLNYDKDALKSGLDSKIYGWTLSFSLSTSDGNWQWQNLQVYTKDDTSASGFGSSVTPTEGDYYYFWRQGWTTNTNTMTTVSKASLPKGKYNFSIDYKGATSGGASYLTIKAKVGNTEKASVQSTNFGNQSSNTSYFNSAEWTTLNTTFTLDEASSTTFSVIQLLNGGTKNNNISRADIYLDNVRLTYQNINGDILAGLIAQATSINALTNNLSSAISTAQSAYDGINNTPAYQTTIDGAISTLQSAIITATAGLTMSPNTDASSLICNPGFELSTAITENKTTNTSIDYTSTGWTIESTSTSNSCGAVVAYGGAYTLNGASAPTSDNVSATGNALGISVGWGTLVSYKNPTITLPAGYYTLSSKGFNNNSSGTDFTSKLGFVPTSGDSQLSTKTSYTYNAWEDDNVSIFLSEATEGAFQVGGKADGSGNTSTTHAKVFLDNISLTYLGNLIQNVSTAMTVGEAKSLTADKWYAITLAAGTYSFTVSDAENLVYVTDGTVIETTSSTSAFSANGSGNYELASGTYYIKSSSAQSLTISLFSYDYDLGSVATSIADGEYIQSLTTLTYSYADASTSDPDASFALLNNEAVVTLSKDGSSVANGTLSLDGKVLTATFTDVTLIPNSTYTLALPANVVGYDDEAENEAIHLTVHTPYVFDGSYFIKNTEVGTYMTVGGAWGTQTTLNEVGDLHTVTALADGTYTLHNNNMSGNLYVKDGYSDSGSAYYFTISSDGDIRCGAEGKYLASASGSKSVSTVETVSAYTKWQFITAAERDATISSATGASPVDITYKYFTNPDVAWAISSNQTWTGTSLSRAGSSTNNGVSRDNNLQCWNANFDAYITLTDLPNGVYQFSAVGFYRAGDSSNADAAHTADTEALNAYIYANEVNTQVKSIMECLSAESLLSGEESSVTGGYVPNSQYGVSRYVWNDKVPTNTVTVLVTDGTLKFGMKKETLISTDWSVFDNFRLKYLGTDVAANKAALANMINMVTREAPTVNIHATDAFKYNYSASDLTTAQGVYDNASATVSDVQTAISNLYNSATVLNAPNESDVYSLYLVDGLNKTVTFKSGNATSGGYAIGYTEDAGSFYNQAIHFKSTGTANQYKLYIVDGAGTKHYICVGTKYSGDDSQIRTTEVESDALPVEVIATATDGEYNLKNTTANALIGSNGNEGFYTAQTYKQFNINAASTVSVGLSIAAGKLATRIFPFTPTLPEGVEAYACDASTENTLTLTKVDSPEANTPYILYSESAVESTDLTGWGTATADSYTQDYLTGVYTNAVVPEGSYVLQTQDGTQAFYKADGVGKSSAYRVYVTVPATQGVKMFTVNLAGLATAIEAARAAGETTVRYNLAGQRVDHSQLKRGIYIVNGKKVLVK